MAAKWANPTESEAKREKSNKRIEETKMKLTWKKKNQSNNINNKKRPLSTNPNLPFDQQDDDHAHNTTNINPISDSTDGLNDGVRSKTLASTDDETTSLAESFRNQGNKLAEVFSLLCV